MVPMVYKSLKRLCLVLPLLALVLSLSPAMPLAESSLHTRPPHTAIYCLIGSHCADVRINAHV
jgi:hypothetical protein